jgi:hypothetical protein
MEIESDGKNLNLSLDGMPSGVYWLNVRLSDQSEHLQKIILK